MGRNRFCAGFWSTVPSRTCSTTSEWKVMIVCCGPSARCTNSRSIITTVCWASCFSFYSRNYCSCKNRWSKELSRDQIRIYTLYILTDWLMLIYRYFPSLGALRCFLFEIVLGRASHRTPAKKPRTTFVPNSREEIEANAGNIIQNVRSRFLTSTITICTCEIVTVISTGVHLAILPFKLHLSTCRDTFTRTHIEAIRNPCSLVDRIYKTDIFKTCCVWIVKLVRLVDKLYNNGMTSIEWSRQNCLFS